MELKEKNKKQFGLRRIKASINNSLNGLKETYKNEQSVYIHLACSIILVAISLVLNIEISEWLIIITIIGLTLVVELINTAIESTVDLVTQEYQPLAKNAKDQASAAEFVLTVVSIIIIMLIFIPKIVTLL